MSVHLHHLNGSGLNPYLFIQCFSVIFKTYQCCNTKLHVQNSGFYLYLPLILDVTEIPELPTNIYIKMQKRRNETIKFKTYLNA